MHIGETRVPLNMDVRSNKDMGMAQELAGGMAVPGVPDPPPERRQEMEESLHRLQRKMRQGA